MSNLAFGIINFPSKHIKVEGLEDYRPIAAFSFLGRYRVIDFPISNMSNSGIDRIHIYVNNNPRSISEHIGSGRHYNINSKRGKLQLLFPKYNDPDSLYNTDIQSYLENMAIIDRTYNPYVVIAPSYMVFKQDYDALLLTHMNSGADITMLYHKVDNAKEYYLSSNVLNLNKQKGVLSITQNLGNTKDKNIFMDTYVMSKELFVSLVKEANKTSSLYTMMDIINDKCSELDIRGVAHKGFFAALTTLKEYFDASRQLLDIKEANDLISADWPIYTKTTDSCPAHYYDGAQVKNSMIANGCLIEGTVENSVLGRNVHVKKGAVVKDSVILAYTLIDENVHVENTVVDKWCRLTHKKEIISPPDHLGYVKRNDTI
ncbi:MAG: glucose-1-phosphate adenylyltransferase subunit GlgD [Lachnospiraceae bacterium]|nr:glucose-1-phosphate adenylyltransferase subunit GlgD [Lachnospiraceae bacterium]